MKKILLTLLAIVLVQTTSAQFATTFIDEVELQFKVKQIDEFMQRFNYDITYDGKMPTMLKDSIKNKENRIKNMLTLFNLDKYMDKNKKPKKIALDLIEYAIKSNCKLKYTDSTWTAILKCWSIYQGQKRNINLYLNVEKIKDVEYKWVISNVNGKMFENAKDSTNKRVLISPAEHGIGFMSVPTTINTNALSISSLDYKAHKNDNLSIFNFLIASKALKITNIEKVSYRYVLGKYSFDVERIEKEKSYNKGWLINNIKCE